MHTPAAAPRPDPVPRRPRGSGSITPDKSRPGWWIVTWPIKGRPRGKVRVRGSRIDAQKALDREIAARDAGTGARDHRMTLDTWLDTWLDTHVEAKAIGTRVRYRDLTDRLIRPSLGRVKLAELDDVALARFKAELVRKGRSRRGADSVLDVLSTALTAAIKSPRPPISANPRRLVAREHKARRAIVAPTRAEADAILAAVADQPLRFAAFALSIGHGLRESEVLGLQRGDRSRDGRILSVQRKAARDGTLTEEPKDAGARDVVLKPWVADALDALGPGAPASLYFPGRRDPSKPLNPHTLLDWVHEVSDQLELRKRYTWHDLRRAYGTRIGAVNGPATVTAAMGHRDYRTSMLYIAAGEVVDDMEPPAIAARARGAGAS